MITLHLMHPVYGQVAERPVDNGNTAAKIKDTWRKRYGKQYEKCTIEEKGRLFKLRNRSK